MFKRALAAIVGIALAIMATGASGQKANPDTDQSRVHFNLRVPQQDLPNL